MLGRGWMLLPTCPLRRLFRGSCGHLRRRGSRCHATRACAAAPSVVVCCLTHPMILANTPARPRGEAVGGVVMLATCCVRHAQKSRHPTQWQATMCHLAQSHISTKASNPRRMERQTGYSATRQTVSADQTGAACFTKTVSVGTEDATVPTRDSQSDKRTVQNLQTSIGPDATSSALARYTIFLSTTLAGDRLLSGPRRLVSSLLRPRVAFKLPRTTPQRPLPKAGWGGTNKRYHERDLALPCECIL